MRLLLTFRDCWKTRKQIDLVLNLIPLLDLLYCFLVICQFSFVNFWCDVTMGSFDGAKICELIGLYVLDQPSNILIPVESFGLCRDDGQAIFPAFHDQIRKELSRTLETCLQPTISKELSKVCNKLNFFDVTFKACNRKYWPYKKSNSQLQYTLTQSNHPPIIKKQLLKIIEKILCQDDREMLLS